MKTEVQPTMFFRDYIFHKYHIATVVLISLLLLISSRSLLLLHLPPVYNDDTNLLLRTITNENASAIFNTVQGALKSKNAQIEPIGVSFIPAYIPTGTLLYHGNGDGEVPKGPEWIAMDHEFSYNFISDRGGPRRNNSMDHGPGGHPQGPPDGPGHRPHTPDGPRGPPSDSPNSHVSLLTFRVERPLTKMILLDGSSAAKTRTGEMDQQFILSEGELSNDPFVDEREAAEKICKWGSTFGLDGFIRIEVGYEAVICDFSKLELVNKVTLDWKNDTWGLPLEIEGELNDEYDLLENAINAMEGYDQIKLGNVHNKGEGRILLDWRGFQTALNKTYVGVDPYTRRIYNSSKEVQDEIRDGLATFLKNGAYPYVSTNWQLVTSEIVDKFSPTLKIMNQTLWSGNNDVDIAKNLTAFTANFVRRFMNYEKGACWDRRILDAKRSAVKQYAHPYQPLQSESDILIYSSIHKVVRLIVDMIFDSFEVSRDIIQQHFKKQDVDASGLERIQADMQSLLTTLRWDSTFYTCPKKCDWDEVCYTPSWGPSPLGWNGGLGKSEDPEGRLRIDKELQCISYRTIMNRSS